MMKIVFHNKTNLRNYGLLFTRKFWNKSEIYAYSQFLLLLKQKQIQYTNILLNEIIDIIADYNYWYLDDHTHKPLNCDAWIY